MQIKSDINDFWVEFPNLDSLNLKVVKPKDVVMIIIEAIKQGWKPVEKGSPMVFEWDSDKLVLVNLIGGIDG